jgi:hypothetical protein
MGCFSRGRKTATGGTAFTQFVPPFPGTSGAQPTGGPGILPGAPPTGVHTPGRGIIHVKNFQYIVPTTAHLVTIMRPLNWTYLTANAAASQAVVVIANDPGAYATAGNYRYSLPNGQTIPSTANNLIAASDYVMYQATAGQWVLDTVASVSGLSITLTNNVPTGGTLANTPLYWFGVSTDTDPWTNEAHQQFDVLAAASNTANYSLSDSTGLWHTYHQGDPLVFYSSNATTAGFIELISGEYSEN